MSFQGELTLLYNFFFEMRQTSERIIDSFLKILFSKASIQLGIALFRVKYISNVGTEDLSSLVSPKRRQRVFSSMFMQRTQPLRPQGSLSAIAIMSSAICVVNFCGIKISVQFNFFDSFASRRVVSIFLVKQFMCSSLSKLLIESSVKTKLKID